MSSELRVGDIMTRNVITISTDETIVEVAKLMKKHDIGSVIIVDGQKRAKGIVTERDVIHKLIAAGKDVASTKVEAVMSKPLRVITPDTPLEVAAQETQPVLYFRYRKDPILY